VTKEMWHAPFTPDQVAALNYRQRSLLVHPYTCGNDSQHPLLVAAKDGWTCPGCDYTQDWAHPAKSAPQETLANKA
jgi:hypothetical protein